MLPNFFIIGAMKSGTTSLHHYLDLHPQIGMATVKETDYLVEEKNFHKGGRWYESLFVEDAPARGEASHNYTAFPLFKGVPARMKALAPDAKLIYIVRDPVDRLISHYVHRYTEWRGDPVREERTLDQALENFDGNMYVDRSRYFFQLQQYFPHFSREKILVVSSEDLRDDRRETLSRVFRHLEVDENFDCPEFDVFKNESYTKRRFGPLTGALMRAGRRVLGPRESLAKIAKSSFLPFGRPVKRPVVEARVMEKLRLYFKDDVAELRRWTGDPFEKWRV